MSESAILDPEMSRSMYDAILFPEIRSSMDDSAILDCTGMNTRLCMAAERGDVNALNKLIQDHVNIFEQFTGLGNSVLHIAISCRKWKFVERVLEEVKRNLVAGREFVGAKNSDGNTALHLAAFHGHVEGVKKIVEAMRGDVEGGDDFLRSQNHQGNTALHQAAKGTSYGGRWFKRSHWEGRYEEVVEILLMRNNDLLSLQNNEGESALFVASQKGHTHIVKKLLAQLDSNSNMKRRDGQTPLHAAVLNGHTGVVERLVQHSPELAKETDNCGRTAMHMLAFSVSVGGCGLGLENLGCKTKIVRTLLEKDNSLVYKKDN